MGLIQAFTGALGGTLADQWKDFLTVPAGASATTGLVRAVPQGQNAGRGSNTQGSTNVISNGSKIVVPQGFGLIVLADGGVADIALEPGGYIVNLDDPNARSVFAGDGIIDSVVKTAWERFKFGGQPGSQHVALFVNLKEIPNNKFGTQSEIYWDDRYVNAQVGAMVRGTYTLRIVDPMLFITQFVPAAYTAPGGAAFDFADMDNDAGAQLFNEVVGSLSAAFAGYTNDPNKGNRMARIQQDSLGFAQSLSAAVETAYQWRSGRGLEIVKTAVVAIEYDEDTRRLLTDVKKADALSGARGNSFLQQSAARGLEAAGAAGGAGMTMFGMGVGAVGGVTGGMQQQPTPTPGPFTQPPTTYPPQAPAYGQAPAAQPVAPGPVDAPVPAEPGAAPAAPAASPAGEDPTAKLTQLKSLLDAGLITQADYDAAKAKALGL